MPALHFFNDYVLPLPVIAIAALVMTFWGTLAIVVHLVVVPRLCGPDGRRFGSIHSEVPSLVALTLGLFVSFNAVWIWERHERVGQAIINEATALTAILDDADGLPPASGNALRDRGALNRSTPCERLLSAPWAAKVSHKGWTDESDPVIALAQ